MASVDSPYSNLTLSLPPHLHPIHHTHDHLLQHSLVLPLTQSLHPVLAELPVLTSSLLIASPSASLPAIHTAPRRQR